MDCRKTRTRDKKSKYPISWHEFCLYKHTMKQFNTQMGKGFTLIELLIVISIVAILAAIGISLSGTASRKAKEMLTKAQLHKLTTAIESYRADFNQYPPDNAYKGQNIDPTLNQLYYELTGTIFWTEIQSYEPVAGGEPLNLVAVRRVFNTSGFLNTIQRSQKETSLNRSILPKNYIGNLNPNESIQLPISGVGKVSLIVAPVIRAMTSLSTPPLAKYTTDSTLLKFCPWNYVSSNPTNNPGSYDLWVELSIGKEQRLIANWED